MKKAILFVVMLIVTLFSSNIFADEPFNEIEFSKNSGAYTEDFYLELKTPLSNVEIYYTLDGNIPKPGKRYTYLYENPIRIYDRTSEENILAGNEPNALQFNREYASGPNFVMKGIVIRAIVKYPSGNFSKVYNGTYLVRNDAFEYFNLPIVSLIGPPEYFIGRRDAIYQPFPMGEEERTIMEVQYILPGNELLFSYDAEVKIFGGFTRNFPQKSMTLNFNKGLEENTIKYPLFGQFATDEDGDPLDSFERLRLHSGGNDSKSTNFSEGLIHELSMGYLDVSTTAFQPSITFVDGEYWGIYSIREHYTSDYFKDHYNADKNNLVMIEFIWGCNNNPDISEGTLADRQLYYDMYTFVRDNDMTLDENYNIFKNEYMDILSFMDNYSANIFFANRDWPGNNNKLWRTRTPEEEDGYLDSKWRYLLHDLDAGFKDPYYDIFAHLNGDFGTGPPTDPWATIFYRKLMENETFFNDFLDRLLYHTNYTYERDRVMDGIKKYQLILGPNMYHQKERWALTAAFPWYQEIEKMRVFARYRARLMLQDMDKHYNTGQVTKVKIDNILYPSEFSISFGNNEFYIPEEKNSFFYYSYVGKTTHLKCESENFKGFLIKDDKGTRLIEKNEIDYISNIDYPTIELIYEGDNDIVIIDRQGKNDIVINKNSILIFIFTLLVMILSFILYLRYDKNRLILRSEIDK